MTVTPGLHLFDAAATRDVDLRLLGCDREWEHRLAPNLPVCRSRVRDGDRLHPGQRPGDCRPGARVRRAWPALARFRQAPTERPCGFSRPGRHLSDLPWA